MKRIALAVLPLLAACSDAGKAGERAAPPTATPPAANTAATTAATETAATPVSRYTSLKDCVETESGAGRGEDWAISRCPGQGEWTLLRDYGDAREYLRLGRGTEEPVQVAMGYSGFNTLGETIEWRGTGAGDAFAPSTLILRNFVSEDPEHSERQTALLMVIDLGRRCVIGEVRPGADQNERARAIADAPGRACRKDSAT